MFLIIAMDCHIDSYMMIMIKFIAILRNLPRRIQFVHLVADLRVESSNLTVVSFFYSNKNFLLLSLGAQRL